jgi:hypothetical protein
MLEGSSPLGASPWPTDLKFTFLLILAKMSGMHEGVLNMVMLGAKRMARSRLDEKNAVWKNYGCKVNEFFTEAFICSGYGVAVSRQFLPYRRLIGPLVARPSAPPPDFGHLQVPPSPWLY